MKPVPIGRHVHFGTAVRYLQDCEAGWPVFGEGYTLQNLDAFFAYLQENELRVTERAAWDLFTFADELRTLAAEHKLTAAEAKKLGEMMARVRATLDAEALGRFAYIVTEKRLQVPRLLDDVGGLMAPGVFEKLPPIAKYDLAEAGKCTAFERPTAAAFHLLRGTEATLRQFYCCIVKRDRVSPLLWGPMIDSLRARKTPPPKPMLDNLDNIRHSFRNPTQHPEKIYDIQEVQDLFGLCIDVISRMAT